MPAHVAQGHAQVTAAVSLGYINMAAKACAINGNADTQYDLSAAHGHHSNCRPDTAVIHVSACVV